MPRGMAVPSGGDEVLQRPVAAQEAGTQRCSPARLCLGRFGVALQNHSFLTSFRPGRSQRNVRRAGRTLRVPRERNGPAGRRKERSGSLPKDRSRAGPMLVDARSRKVDASEPSRRVIGLNASGAVNDIADGSISGRAMPSEGRPTCARERTERLVRGLDDSISWGGQCFEGRPHMR